ncbi:hypothetical protein CEXT_520701 [Caerostris extrusa]|uniref:Uncharacterized protein n=1 Tax=Caerostris extrusa TaxID=172846 RepID=A0AAV4RPB5_CAEEX|nr:hypothetical protein CEXT_520701 [Caerostris extrusa]
MTQKRPSRLARRIWARWRYLHRGGSCAASNDDDKPRTTCVDSGNLHKEVIRPAGELSLITWGPICPFVIARIISLR